MTTSNYGSPGLESIHFSLQQNPSRFIACTAHDFNNQNDFNLSQKDLDEIRECYGKNAVTPTLKTYFGLSDAAWEKFSAYMNEEEPSEKTFYLVSFRPYGQNAPILKRLQEVLKHFQPITCFYKNGNALLENLFLVITSHSQFQNYLRVKAEEKKRTPIICRPHFGAISEEEVESMKRKGQCPSGLFFSAIKRSKWEAINTHLKGFDGHVGDAHAFGTHDDYHMIREMEMTDAVSKGRFRVIDILRNTMTMTDEVSRTISRLIDGELLYCYPYSLTENRTLVKEQKFGELLKDKLSKQAMDLVLADFLEAPQKWEEIGLSKEDLLPEQKRLIKTAHSIKLLLFLFSQTEEGKSFSDNKSKLHVVSDLRNETFSTDEEYVVLKNCRFKEVKGKNLLLLHSKVDSVTATHCVGVKSKKKIVKIEAGGSCAVFGRSHIKELSTSKTLFLDSKSQPKKISANRLQYFQLTEDKEYIELQD